MSTEEIVAEIRRCRGTQFDPALADVFIKIILQRGPSFLVNSARSVTQQYAASLLANTSITHNMFEWMLEKQPVENQPIDSTAFVQITHMGSGVSPSPSLSKFRLYA
jgi:hypothetical protein